MPSLLTSNTYGANSGDNTIFRAYGTAIANAFANSGWVGVDTGSTTNWGTVVANGTANATQVNAFDVWRMDDALQSSVPVFVRLDYMTLQTANSPGVRVTLGAGTDGVGNLTGVLGPNNAVRVVAAAASSHPFYFCGANNRIVIAGWTDITNNWLLSIERTHDVNGGDTADGVLVSFGATIASSTAAQYFQYFWNPYTGPATAETDIGFFGPQANTSIGNGNVMNLYPIYISRGIFCNPCLNTIVAPTYFATPFAPFTVTFYGASHTFLPIGSNFFPNRNLLSPGVYGPAIRWEL